MSAIIFTSILFTKDGLDQNSTMFTDTNTKNTNAIVVRVSMNAALVISALENSVPLSIMTLNRYFSKRKAVSNNSITARVDTSSNLYLFKNLK